MLAVKVEKPQYLLTREAKERILFLLCLANFGSWKVKNFTNSQIWERFRKGHFVFTKSDCFHDKILTEVVWTEILAIYIISVPLVINIEHILQHLYFENSDSDSGCLYDKRFYGPPYYPSYYYELDDYDYYYHDYHHDDDYSSDEDDPSLTGKEINQLGWNGRKDQSPNRHKMPRVRVRKPHSRKVFNF